MFTMGQWVLFGILFVLIVLGSLGMDAETGDWKVGTIVGGLLAFILVIAMAIVGWYNSNTASGKRNMKDFHSNINDGISREIIITAEDGREIFRYEGKVDIESNHNDNYIKLDDKDGKRYIIYYGVQDTITIIEK